MTYSRHIIDHIEGNFPEIPIQFEFFKSMLISQFHERFREIGPFRPIFKILMRTKLVERGQVIIINLFREIFNFRENVSNYLFLEIH